LTIGAAPGVDRARREDRRVPGVAVAEPEQRRVRQVVVLRAFAMHEQLDRRLAAAEVLIDPSPGDPVKRSLVTERFARTSPAST
jgi:hypothetical protein